MKNILNFQTLPKKEQIRKCSEIFGIEAKYALDYVEKLPNYSTFIPEDIRSYVKWCAVPNTSANLNAYEKLINKLVDIKNAENRNYDWRGYTWYNLKSIKQNSATIDFLDKISSWQAGDILLLPVVIRKHENNFPEEILAGLGSNVFPLGLQTTMSIATLNNIEGLNFACLGDSCYYDNARPDMYGYDEEYASVIRHNDIPQIKISRTISFEQQEYVTPLVNKYSMYVFCPYENFGSVNSCEILNRPRDYYELLELYIQKYPFPYGKLYFHFFSFLQESIFGEKFRYRMDFNDFESWFEKNSNSLKIQEMFVKHQKIMKELLKKREDEFKRLGKQIADNEINFQITAINYPERLVFGTPQGLFDNN